MICRVLRLLVVVAIVLIGSFCLTIAQESWDVLTSSAAGYGTIQHVTNDIIVAVGSEGRIARSTDGGRYWVRQRSGTRMSLSNVHFFDSDRGIAVGGKGTVFYTLDGGIVWQQRETEIPVNLYAVFHDRTGRAYAVGDSGTIIISMDGGRTWRQETSGTRAQLLGVVTLADATAFAVGDSGIILKTTDGGENWQRMESGTNVTLSQIRFSNDVNGIAVGAVGIVLRTVDGGATWHQEFGSLAGNLRTVSVVSPTTAFAIDPVSCQRTTNGGDIWLDLEPLRGINNGDRIFLADVSFRNEQEGMIVGLGDAIVATSDGGESWRLQAHTSLGFPGSEVFIANIMTSESGDLFLLGDGGVHRSTDRGATWLFIPTNAFDTFFDGHFSSPDSGFVIGDNTCQTTTDGGRTWNLRFGVPRGWDLHFFDRYRGMLAADSILWRTTDGGSTWTRQSMGDIFGIRRLRFIDDSLGYAAVSSRVGVKIVGRVWRTQDGGATWDSMAASEYAQFIDIHFKNRDTGFVVGTHGTILRTVDGGDSWDSIPGGTGADLISLVFLNDTLGFIAGGDSQAVVLATTNGGATWKAEDIGTNYLGEPFRRLAVAYPLAGDTLVVAGTGIVLRKILSPLPTSSVARERSRIHSAASMRSYPNPATSSLMVEVRNTSGNLAMSHRFELYDLLGRSITYNGPASLIFDEEAATLTASLDLEGVPPGYYLLVCRGGGELLANNILVGNK